VEIIAFTQRFLFALVFHNIGGKVKKAYTSGFGEATIIRFFAQDDRRGHFHIV
jgi:hypothetical protein